MKSPSLSLRLLLAAALLGVGCGPIAGSDDDDSGPSYPDVALYDFEDAAPWYSCPDDDDFPDEVTTVTVFDSVDQNSGLRTVEAVGDFPDEGDWAQVGLWFELECPDGGVCDHWDRLGSVQLVLNPDAPAEERETLELLRQITPYRIPMCQYVDVTPVASLLKGPQTLSSFIDTWVGPGNASGDGWRTTARFVFTPGRPAGASAVANVWGFKHITVGETAAGTTVDDQIEPTTVSIPADAERVLAHITTTGHSFGNTYNCAEFCQMRHDIDINGETVSWSGWRDDCDQNPHSPQYGTWEYGRNGWCPGAVSVGGMLDVTDLVTPGEEASIDFFVGLSDGSEYENTSPVELRPYTYVALRLYSWDEAD